MPNETIKGVLMAHNITSSVIDHCLNVLGVDYGRTKVAKSDVDLTVRDKVGVRICWEVAVDMVNVRGRSVRLVLLTYVGRLTM